MKQLKERAHIESYNVCETLENLNPNIMTLQTYRITNFLHSLALNQNHTNPSQTFYQTPPGLIQTITEKNAKKKKTNL